MEGGILCPGFEQEGMCKCTRIHTNIQICIFHDGEPKDSLSTELGPLECIWP